MIAGLKMLPEDAEVTLYSDSELCVKTANEWAAKWERRGWRRSEKHEVKNLDLVKRLYEIRQARPRVRIEWVRGHSGIRWNEYADALSMGKAGGTAQGRTAREAGPGGT